MHDRRARADASGAGDRPQGLRIRRQGRWDHGGGYRGSKGHWPKSQN